MSTPHKMPPPVPLPQDLRGTNIGRFAIRTKLGAGGMGEVYYAEDAKLLRPVALKRLSTAAADNPAAPRKILEEARRASLVRITGKVRRPSR